MMVGDCMKTKEGKKLLTDFENMRDMAELRALSAVSLERPLSDHEYERMMELGKKVGLVKDRRYKIQKNR